MYFLIRHQDRERKKAFMCVPPQILYKSSDHAEKNKEFCHIEKNKLDAKVEGFIEKTFGSKTRKTLLRVMEDIGDITCVPVVVFPDDTVKDLHDKIHIALGSSPKENKTSLTPVYTWCNTQSFDEMTIKDVVLDRFYAHSDLPKTWGHLLASLQQSVYKFKINTKKTNIDVNRLFDKRGARQMLESHVHVREGMLQNLNFHCVNEDDQNLIFPVDPFSEEASSPFFDINDDADFITIVPHLQRPVESFAPHENIIHFCLKNDAPSIYFPRDATLLGLDEASLKKTRERMELMSDLRADMDNSPVHFDTQTSVFKVSYHRTQSIVGEAFAIPLAFLFNNLSLQADLFPFMSFKSRTGTIYKLDKNALAPQGRIMQRNLDLWTMFGQKSGENIATGQKEALIFKVDTKTSFATLILYENGELDVRAYFSLHDQASFDQLEELLLNPVNRVIQKMNAFLQTMSFDTSAHADMIITPLHKQDIHGSILWENKPRLNAHCWFYRKGAKTPKVNMKQLIQIFHQLSPYFVVIQKESAKKEDVIHLAYKRTDDFYSLQNMYAFVHRFLKSGAKEGQEKTQVQLFANVFDLPIGKAKKILRMIKEDAGPTTGSEFRQPFQYLHIQILPISRGFRVFLEDITHIRYFDRVMYILQIAFANAFQNMPDTTNTKKKSQSLNIPGFEEESRSRPPRENDIGGENFSFSDGGDLLSEFDLDLEDADALFLEEMRQESKTSPLKESGPSPRQAFFPSPRISSISDGNAGSAPPISPNTIFNEDVHEVYQGVRAYQDKNEAPAREYVTDNILRNLQKADPDLFQKNNYSTDCQMVLTSSARQPVVVRPEELQKIQRKYPGSIPNYIAYGSSRETAKENVYFCPDVWCPQSRVAMTRAQFEDNNGKCPDPEEPPIAYYKSKYYNDPKSDTNKRGYISFLKKDESTSFCLPCCGKKIPKARNEDIKKCNVSIVDRHAQKDTKKHKKKSVASERLSNTDEEDVHDIIMQMREDAKQIEKEKYILKDFPLPARRLGYIPTSLLRFISGKNYNEVGIENGHVSKSTDAYLRRGNAPTQQSFLHCLSKILQKPDIEDEQALKSLLLRNLSVQDFLFMQNGAVFRVFQAENMDSIVQDTHAFNAFKTWFMKQDGYIKQFHLTHIYKKISKKKVLDTADIEMMREFHIYNAYQNFMRYLENDNIIKTHDFFTGFLSRGSKWLHALGFNLVVFEEREGRVYYSCPVGIHVDMTSFQKPTVMLYRRQNYYEIIYHVKMVGSKVQLTVFAEDDLHIMQMLYNLGISCRNKEVNDIQDQDEYNIQRKINSILENEWQHKIKAFVIDYNLKHVGYLLANDDLFVPLHTGFPLLQEQWTKDKVFIDTMYNIVRPGDNTKIAAKEILEALNQKLGVKYYETSSHASCSILKVSFPQHPESHVHYIILDPDLTCSKQKDELQDTLWYKDSLIFTRVQSSDPRKDLVDITRAIDNLQIALLNEIIHYVLGNAALTEEVELLRNALNPMPMLTKRRILFGYLDKYVRRKIVLLVDESEKEMYKKMFLDSLCSIVQKEDGCRAQCVWTEKRSKKNMNVKGTTSCLLRVPKKMYMNLMARCLDDLLNPYFQLKYVPFIHNGKMQDNVLVFTPQEVEDGRLRNITSQSNNAFVSTLGYRQRTKDLEIEILDKNFFDRASVKKVVRGTQDTAQHLIIPYGFNAFLAEFSLVERNYKPYTLFEIFSTLYNVVHTIQHGSSKMSAENLRNAIMEKVYQNLLRDFDKTLDFLKQGLSFFKGTSAQEYRQYILEENGYPSEYEIALMGELVGINTILLVRKSKKTDQKNIKRLYANKSSDYYVIFVERKCQKDKCYRYDIVQKKDKIFFHKEKIPEKFMRYIPRKSFFVS